jgi:hypothetical protein
MASTCLTYLCLEEIKKRKVPDPPIENDGAQHKILKQDYLNGHHFLEYSIEFLGLHLRESQTDSARVDVPGMGDFLATGSRALQNWVRAYDLLKRWTHGKCKSPVSLSEELSH